MKLILQVRSQEDTKDKPMVELDDWSDHERQDWISSNQSQSVPKQLKPFVARGSPKSAGFILWGPCLNQISYWLIPFLQIISVWLQQNWVATKNHFHYQLIMVIMGRLINQLLSQYSVKKLCQFLITISQSSVVFKLLLLSNSPNTETLHLLS